MALRASKLPTSSKLVKSNVSFAGGSPGRKLKGTQSTTEFSKHLHSLQKHAEENIEDEYIKNLQQQIAYMELELKLLKEKEMESKASVSQIDRFFNDGVPLNENILALKNQYNQTKKDYEDRIDENNDQRLAEEKAQRDLKNQYNMLVARLHDINEDSKGKQKDFEKSIKELRFTFLNEKNMRIDLEKELKGLQEELKKTNDENLTIQRDLDKRKMMAPNRKERDENLRNKSKRELAAKDEHIVKLEDELEDLKTRASFNPMIEILETENKDLQEKSLRCEKEINIANSRIKEMQMALESRAREREREADQRRELIEKINHLKANIDKQNKVNELVIEQKVKEKEQKEIRDITKIKVEVKKDQTIHKDRLRACEENIDNMSQEKIGMHQDIHDAEQKQYVLDKQEAETKRKILELKNHIEDLTYREKTTTIKLEPMEKEVDKVNKIIPDIENENEKLHEQLTHLGKQLELSSQLKGLNLEELKILKNTNDNVFNTLNDMTKKWEFLQRFTKVSNELAK